MLVIKPFHAEPTNLIPAGAKAHFVGNFTKYDQAGDLYITTRTNSKNDEEISAIWVGKDFPEYYRDSKIAGALDERYLGSNLQAAFHRAIEQGILTVTTYIAGVSRIKDSEIDEAYRASDYYQGWLKVWNNGSHAEDAWDNYRATYKQEHGEIPKNSRDFDYHIFDSEDEAKQYCLEGEGKYVVVKAVNEYHLRCKMSVLQLRDKI